MTWDRVWRKAAWETEGQALRRTCWLNDGCFHPPLVEAAEQLQLFLIPTQQKQEGMEEGDGGPCFLMLIAWKVTRVQGKQKHLTNTQGKKKGGAEKYVKDTIIPSTRVQWQYLPHLAECGPVAWKGEGDRSIGSMKRIPGWA